MADDLAYEGSDESSESELLDQSLSVWKGVSVRDEHFLPIPLDLHTAASIGQYDSVRAIIDRAEVSLNEKNTGGWTALMYAAYIGHDNILNLLLDANVEVNVSDNKGLTPLMLAASCGNESVAYFLLQAGAKLEARDQAGWTGLLHATYSGHQELVKFLLQNGATTNTVEPVHGYTPLMEAAASGHEIIVQSFLQHGVNVDLTCTSGNTALSIALMNGHTKIVSLIRNHINGPSLALHGLRATGDFSSSDEATPGVSKTQHTKNNRCKTRSTGPNIQEGPEALARMMNKNKDTPSTQHTNVTIPGGYVPRDYVTFEDCDGRYEPDEIRFRDVTSPISADDFTAPESPDQQDENDRLFDVAAFSQTGAVTIRSCGESSGGLVRALGLTESSDEGDELDRHPATLDPSQQKQSRQGPEVSPEANSSESEGEAGGPRDLEALLRQHGLTKYLCVFEEQDVDLQVFLSLTDNDLKEVGIKLFGPRRKMTNAIARWHSKAEPSRADSLEKAYADKLEAEMQEMAIQLHKAYEQGEYLKRHALQESELRSVAETLLMEDRAAWQNVCRLASQVRHQCSHLQVTVESLRPYEEEMARRLGFDLSLSSTVTNDNHPHGRNCHQDVAGLNIDQMSEAIVDCHKDLCWILSENIMSAEQLLESAAQAGTMHGGVS